MITTVFTLDKRYAASAISNSLDLLASFFAPFLDKFVSHRPPSYHLFLTIV